MHGISRWLRASWLVVLLVLALTLPWLLSPYELGRVSIAYQLTLAVLSLTLLIGLCGQISLGQSAFVGLGAYTTTILVADYRWSFAAAAVAAVVVTGLLGLLVGLPALRLRGIYVALTSLGIAMVFPTILQSADGLTGGTGGKGLGVPLLPPLGSGLDPTQFVYLITLAITVGVLVLVHNIKSSRMGRALQAIRDQEHVSEAFGIRVGWTKLLCFMISSAIAGLSGVLFAIQRQFVSPGDFGLDASIDYFVGMAVGGKTSILGSVVGGGFLEYTPGLIEMSGIDLVFKPLVYGLILIAIMRYARDGLAGAATKVLSRLSGGRRDAPPSGPQSSGGAVREDPDDPDAISAALEAPVQSGRSRP